MVKLNNKFAIGCLVQLYEVEIFDEYFESLIDSVRNIKNKENVNTYLQLTAVMRTITL